MLPKAHLIGCVFFVSAGTSVLEANSIFVIKNAVNLILKMAY